MAGNSRRWSLLPTTPLRHFSRRPDSAPSARHDEDRDVLLLLAAVLPIQGYHLCAQRCEGLQILPLEMPQERKLLVYTSPPHAFDVR